MGGVIEVVMMIQEDEEGDIEMTKIEKDDRKEKNIKKLVMHQHQQCQTQNGRRINNLQRYSANNLTTGK